GKLAILTTHDLTLAAQADRLLLLGPEGFVADGPPADVLRDHAAWDRLGLRVPAWLTLPQMRYYSNERSIAPCGRPKRPQSPVLRPWMEI
ncbi:MAG: hypothetical protein JXA14_11695, partial [Anaerolineae bacterium]|nr:hypothetical protein [Anaerolineae bacterium]